MPPCHGRQDVRQRYGLTSLAMKVLNGMYFLMNRGGGVPQQLAVRQELLVNLLIEGLILRWQHLGKFSDPSMSCGWGAVHGETWRPAAHAWFHKQGASACAG
jgi:hypothetical protein